MKNECHLCIRSPLNSQIFRRLSFAAVTCCTGSKVTLTTAIFKFQSFSSPIIACLSKTQIFKEQIIFSSRNFYIRELNTSGASPVKMKRNQYVVIENLSQTASKIFRTIVHCKGPPYLFWFQFHNINKLQNKTFITLINYRTKHKRYMHKMK